MRRRAQHLSYRTAFDYSTKVHYCNSISNLGDNAKVVSDEKDCHPKFCHQIFHQVQHLCLNCHIKRSGRFICNQ